MLPKSISRPSSLEHKSIRLCAEASVAKGNVCTRLADTGDIRHSIFVSNDSSVVLHPVQVGFSTG
jgi:hypothetical protein